MSATAEFPVFLHVADYSFRELDDAGIGWHVQFLKVMKENGDEEH